MGKRNLPDNRMSAVIVAQEVSGLLRGGVPAGRVWQLLGDQAEAPPEVHSIVTHVRAGADIATAMCSVGSEEWRVLSAAWRLAERTGAPFAATLERLGAALVQLRHVSERRDVLLAGPRATMRLVSSLPILAMLLGVGLGFDPFSVLISPVGGLIGLAGGALLLVGIRWATILAQRLAQAEWVAGLEHELCWIALSGGAPQDVAVRHVADCAALAQAAWVKMSQLNRNGSVWQVLRAAAAVGTPAGPMLLAKAEALRAQTLTELEREAERLGVRVLVPLALCILPSFVLLGVVPVLFAVMGSLSFGG